MADILDPIIKGFVGQYARPSAEEVVKAYDTIKHYQIEWTRLQSLTTVPNTSDQVADNSQSSLGAGADGRGPITGQVLTALNTLYGLLITSLEVTATVGGVTKARVEWLRDIAVNRIPRF